MWLPQSAAVRVKRARSRAGLQIGPDPKRALQAVTYMNTLVNCCDCSCVLILEGPLKLNDLLNVPQGSKGPE